MRRLLVPPPIVRNARYVTLVLLLVGAAAALAPTAAATNATVRTKVFSVVWCFKTDRGGFGPTMNVKLRWHRDRLVRDSASDPILRRAQKKTIQGLNFWIAGESFGAQRVALEKRLDRLRSEQSELAARGDLSAAAAMQAEIDAVSIEIGRLRTLEAEQRAKWGPLLMNTWQSLFDRGRVRFPRAQCHPGWTSG